MLTQADRDRFSAWLKNEAEGNRAITEQMEKMERMGRGVMGQIAKRKRAEMAACLIVAGILDSTESVEIG